MHNLGWCYENGWCGYPKSKDLAVQQYVLGARWGVQESGSALVRLGQKPPAPDLKWAQEQAEAREKAAMWAAIGAALLSTASAMNQQPSYNTLQASPAPGLLPATDYQGCCSWHGGIQQDFLGNRRCHYSDMVLCNDYQPSPTCRC